MHKQQEKHFRLLAQIDRIFFTWLIEAIQHSLIQNSHPNNTYALKVVTEILNIWKTYTQF